MNRVAEEPSHHDARRHDTRVESDTGQEREQDRTKETWKEMNKYKGKGREEYKHKSNRGTTTVPTRDTSAGLHVHAHPHRSRLRYSPYRPASRSQPLDPVGFQASSLIQTTSSFKNTISLPVPNRYARIYLRPSNPIVVRLPTAILAILSWRHQRDCLIARARIPPSQFCANLSPPYRGHARPHIYHYYYHHHFAPTITATTQGGHPSFQTRPRPCRCHQMPRQDRDGHCQARSQRAHAQLAR